MKKYINKNTKQEVIIDGDKATFYISYGQPGLVVENISELGENWEDMGRLVFMTLDMVPYFEKETKVFYRLLDDGSTLDSNNPLSVSETDRVFSSKNKATEYLESHTKLYTLSQVVAAAKHYAYLPHLISQKDVSLFLKKHTQ